ncbi:TetR/AcrR family transcriptional regulator [Paenibacillus abyssi]|uniref:TetR family transcriptional regulator n=1 Tax=Paenibacillus abyssi TaxID=1340531 RepID=A0A917G022_9BACL|nr:TetR/AcrR family transcriptional regulator [Paenibacillus abyssi]GGG15639.1 TetR family transcriptional regulator [Paenibacillus abyssi]
MSAAHGDKLNAILDAAYRLFGTRGYYETKMSDIAEEAGIAKGTLYLYFSSKEELFTAMTKRDFDGFIHQLRIVLQCAHTLEEQLTAAAAHHLTYYYRVKDYTRLFFHAPNNDQALMDALNEFLQRYSGIIAELLTSYDIANPKLHAQSFIGILDVFKMDILFNPMFTEEDLELRIDFAVTLFRYGCK